MRRTGHGRGPATKRNRNGWQARTSATSPGAGRSQGWPPPLLAAAGTAPGPGYPPDGMNLLPLLTGNVAAVDRKLFWRYKGKWHRPARIGDSRFLKTHHKLFFSH